MKTITSCLTAIAVTACLPAHAVYKIQINEDNTISFGGYVKADLRNVSGDIAYRDFWIANNVYAPDTNETRFSVRESRFNVKYTHKDITAFVEWDYLDDQQPTGATETVTGGHSLRMRHGFIKYDKWTIGQTWTTFMPLSSIAESLDFGGALVGQSLIRQGMIRYSHNGWDVAIENASTQSGSDQSVPDVVAKYTFQGDWGQVSVAGLMRTLDSNDIPEAPDGTQLSYNVFGRIKVFEKDDLRFSYGAGRSGRYIGPAANISDLATNGDIHEATAYTLAFRHFWNEDWRSSIYFGHINIDELGADRQHLGINLLKSVTDKLMMGAEVGNYKTESGDSNYVMLSAKYSL